MRGALERLRRPPTLEGTKWFVVNVLLLEATLFIALLLFFLFIDDSGEGADEGVLSALIWATLYLLLITVPALPFALAYLLVLWLVAERVSGLRLRRAIAVLLSPIAFLYLFLLGLDSGTLLGIFAPLAIAFAYGAIVRHRAPYRLPSTNGDPPPVSP